MSLRVQQSFALGPEVYGQTTVDKSGQGLAALLVDAYLATLVVQGFTGSLDIRGCQSPTVPTGMYGAAALLTSGATVTSDCAIVTQDSTFTVNSDGTWKLAVATHGSGTTYQWKRLAEGGEGGDSEWDPFPGATAATFNNPTIMHVLPSCRQFVLCDVLRNMVAVQSSVLEMFLPVFVTQPQSQSVNSGDPVTFTANVKLTDATGAQAFTLEGRWLKGAVAIGAWEGFNSEEDVTYTIPVTSPGDDADYVFQVRATYPDQVNKLITQSDAATLAFN